MELNENLECQGRRKLPLSEREVAMPCASVDVTTMRAESRER